jgi:hypothetical protein
VENSNLEALPLFDLFGSCNLRMMRVSLKSCIFASKPFLTASNENTQGKTIAVVLVKLKITKKQKTKFDFFTGHDINDPFNSGN